MVRDTFDAKNVWLFMRYNLQLSQLPSSYPTQSPLYSPPGSSHHDPNHLPSPSVLSPRFDSLRRPPCTLNNLPVSREYENMSREYDRHPHLKYSSISKESLQLAVKACLAFSATSSAAHTFLVPPLQVQSLTIAARVTPDPRNQPWSS